MIKINPETQWGMIESTFRRAAEKTIVVTDDVIGRFRAALLSGEMDAWLFGESNPIGIAVTMIREDVILGRRELIIYAAANLQKLTLKDWGNCFEEIREFAMLAGCTHISYYTKVPRLFEVAQLLGGDAETRYVSIHLEG